jgi:DNA mismatch endonuclease (patch repair protein)
MIVRRLAWKLGARYRLHRNDLPGRPDLVFAKKKRILFVHGCFWHQHNCRRTHTPRTNLSYWSEKLERNRNRDQNNRTMLTAQGWSILVIWECEVDDHERLLTQIQGFLK